MAQMNDGSGGIKLSVLVNPFFFPLLPARQPFFFATFGPRSRRNKTRNKQNPGDYYFARGKKKRFPQKYYSYVSWANSTTLALLRATQGRRLIASLVSAPEKVKVPLPSSQWVKHFRFAPSIDNRL